MDERNSDGALTSSVYVSDDEGSILSCPDVV